MAFYLKVSRPGLWFQTVWLYLLPTSGMAVLDSPRFWFGLVYMTFPVNFLMYGWNDMVDAETDRLNPRKDSWLWGACGSAEQLRRLPLPMALVQLPFVAALLYLSGWPMLLLLTGVLLANGLYNLPRHGWRSKPPLELVVVTAMLLILPISSWLNQLPGVPWPSYAYLWLFCLKAHLMGEIMDLIPDHQAGRRTTAIAIGERATKLVIMALLVMESFILAFFFAEWVLVSFMAFALGWLIYDFFALARDGAYSPAQYRLLGIALNLSGYASIGYVWLSGKLV